MVGDRFREVFSYAKPIIDYAFKVEKPGYIRVWWYDRYLSNVVEMISCITTAAQTTPASVRAIQNA